MKYLVLDTETVAWAPGFIGVPEFAAAGFAGGEGSVALTQDKDEARARVQEALARGYTVVGHNLAFDLAVLGVTPGPDAHLWDTMILDLIERLARDDCWADMGGAPRPKSLETLSGGKMEGKDSVRLSYIPGHPMTAEQRRYLSTDVTTTEQVFLAQLRRMGEWVIPELTLQVRAALALGEIERRGLPVDDVAIGEQEREYQRLRRDAAAELKAAGLWEPEKVGPRGGKRKEKVNVKAFRAHVEKVLEEAGEEATLTDKGALKTDKQVLTQLTHDPLVKAWLTYKSCEKLLSTYLKVWKGAGVVHARYRLMMRTGRTSSHGPNLQQVPSRGAKANIKKVFVAPPGRVFYELDYCQLELCCLAYLTQGEMLRRINAGEDLHKYLATVYFHKPAGQVTKDERQLMKCANFGLPGGMGARKFRMFIKQNGLEDPGHEAAVALRNAWLAAYPEMARWLDDPDGEIWERNVRGVWAGREDLPMSEEDLAEAWQQAEKRLEERGPRIPAEVRRQLARQVDLQAGSRTLETWLVGRQVVVDGGRKRHPVTYTEQHNTKFQGLAANLTKEALASVVLDRGQFAPQVHAFIHDSLLISAPEASVLPITQTAERMLDAARKWLPGVRCGVEIAGPGCTWSEAKQAKPWSVFTTGECHDCSTDTVPDGVS